MRHQNTNWFKKAIVYQVLIDRFAGYGNGDWNQPEFLGGNIRGIINKLDYLSDLGVTALWISPFYKSSAYHGYHITDFKEVDPHFGTLEDIKELIEKCHQRNMDIIAGFVPNHCSSEHPWFRDAQKNKNSKYKDWFIFEKWPDDYLCFLTVKQLPKLNLDNPATRDYIVDAAKYWLSLGFDGYRLDHIVGPRHKFWKHFNREIKKDYPGAVLFGEAWMGEIKIEYYKTVHLNRKITRFLLGMSQDSLQREYRGEMDGVLDFKLRDFLRDYYAFADENTNLDELNEKIEKHYKKYFSDYFLPSFLDNHDLNRFMFLAGNNKEKLKKAATKQFSLPQPAIIYYGTETGLGQEQSVWDQRPYADLEARRPMPWNNLDQDLIDFYKKIISIKKAGQ